MSVVYVNWDTKQVVGAGKMEGIIQERYADYIAQDGRLFDWLEAHCDILEVYRMSEQEKEELFMDYETDEYEQAEKDEKADWDYYEID